MLVCSFQILVRWSLPRFRYDQVLRFAWKFMLPIALANLDDHRRRAVVARSEAAVKVAYQRKRYWNEPTLTLWERAYLPEILRGLAITSTVFLRNMGRWVTGRKGALTTYYPEETRADYAPVNRGKHVLTQRPDGTPQCIACNMCATVCPAKVIEIEAGFDPDRRRASEVPDPLRDRLLALHLLRPVRRGLPGGRDPDGQGGAVAALRRPPRDVARPRGAADLEPAARRRQAVSARTRGTATEDAMIEWLLQNSDTLLLLVCAFGALAGAALMLVLRQPMRVAIALITTMMLLGAIYGLLGVHFIAAFQVLIYVGAVMVFMVYAIMLLEVRETASRRYSRWLVPGVAGLVVLLGAIVASVWRPLPSPVGELGETSYGIAGFSVAFLNEYWFLFELDVGPARRRGGGGARGDQRRQEGARWIGRSS